MNNFTPYTTFDYSSTMEINTFTLGKAIVMFGIGFWISLAVFNNITDMNTNLYFITKMVTMSSIQSDPILGKGILWHTIISHTLPKEVMFIAIFLEGISAFLLLWTGLIWLKVTFGRETLLKQAVFLSNIALIIFFSIWMWFLGGDLWFGFWIKNGAFAQVHSTWIIITLLLFIFINYDPVK